MAEGIGIGRLEQCVKRFAKTIQSPKGEAAVHAHRVGVGCANYGTSYVDLRVGGVSIRFMANGYGSVRHGEIGGLSLTWTEMKQIAIEKLAKGGAL